LLTEIPGIVSSHMKFLHLAVSGIFAPYAPVKVKPQGRGTKHTQGEFTFQYIFTSIIFTGGNTDVKYPFPGLR